MLFHYLAKNQHSETVKGKVDAPSLVQAAAALRSRQLLIIKIDPIHSGSLAVVNNLLFGVKKDDIVNMTRQLSTMITAGLPLVQGLAILEQQSKPALARLLADLRADIEGGSTFAKALEKHPQVFGRVYLQLVKAGETGGVLDKILERLADNLEKDKEFRAKTKGAMIYPAIVVIAMVVVAFVMMIFVIPKLTDMYKDFGADLPLATQLLIDLSSAVARFWWIWLVMMIGGGILFRSWGQTRNGQITISTYMMKVPIIGNLKKKTILTEFARTLSLLLGAGVSLLQALDIVSGGVSNILYREALEDAAKQVEKGVSLGQAISKYNYFPPLLHQMITVGEETGKLEEVLLKLSNYFQTESEHAVKNLTAAIEPLIMVVLGIGVGLMVIAIIMPIYNLTSQF